MESNGEIGLESFQYSKYFYDLAATSEDAKEIAEHLVGFEIKHIKPQILNDQNKIQELNEVMNNLHEAMQVLKNKSSGI